MAHDLIWNGKFLGRRAAARRRAPVIGAYNTERLTAWMCQWIAGKLRMPADQVRPDTAFEDLGLDSLIAVELSGQLEDLLGRSVPASVAWEHRTLGELAAAVLAPAQPHIGDMDRAVS